MIDGTAEKFIVFAVPFAVRAGRVSAAELQRILAGARGGPAWSLGVPPARRSMPAVRLVRSSPLELRR